MVPVRGPQVPKRATIWMTPLEPLTIRAAIPAAIGAARPVWTRAGIVMNPSVAEANTHGANGKAQLNARVLESLDVVAVSASRGATVANSVVPRAAASVTAIATTTRAAATANDIWTPKSPAPAINPPASGPMANPAISTAPAVAAPAGPFRSEAQAVPEVIARPTPTPTIKRPASKTPGCWESSIATVPTTAVAEPANATALRPSTSEARPPMSRPGNSPTA